MKKFDIKRVNEEIDFTDRPHMFSYICKSNRCIYCKANAGDIAESLSMDGTEVDGIFTVDEKKVLERRAAAYIEEELYGVR